MLVIWILTSPEIDTCGDIDVSCDCAQFYNIFEISFVTYTLGVFGFFVHRTVHYCRGMEMATSKTLRHWYNTAVSIFTPIFTVCFILMQSSLAQFDEDCGGSSLHEEQYNFAQVVRAVYGVHCLYMFLSLLYLLLQCFRICGLDIGPDDDELFSEDRSELRNRILKEFESEQLQVIRAEIEGTQLDE